MKKTFTEKVQTLKETFFSETEEEITETTTTSGDVEVVVEGQAEVKKKVPADMAYICSCS